MWLPMHISERAHSRDGGRFIRPWTLPRDFLGTCQSGTMHYVSNPVDREKIRFTSVVRTLILYEPIFWPRLDSILLGDDANFMNIGIFRQALHCLRGWVMSFAFIYWNIEFYDPIKGLMWWRNPHRDASPAIRCSLKQSLLHAKELACVKLMDGRNLCCFYRSSVD